MQLTEKFRYTAYDEAGVRRESEVSAISIESAMFKLKELGLIPVRIERRKRTEARLGQIIQFNPRPKLADLELLTSRLAMLVKNGIRVDRALLTAVKGTKNNRLRKVIEEIYDDIRGGTQLHLSMKKYQDIFDPLYVSIISIGEATGRLADAFEDLSGNLKFRLGVITKTRQALIYPAIILAVCVLAIGFIFNFIVPRFAVIFSSMENMPFYTEVLLATSSFFRRYQLIAIPSAIGLVFFLSRIAKKRSAAGFKDNLVLKLPFVSGLCYARENLRFASALAMLLKSGVVLTEALEYAERAIGNAIIRKRISLIKEEIRQGGKLSETIGKTGFLPEIYIGLIEAGEETGSLPEIFSEIQKRLMGTYETRISTFVATVEPIMIVFMGLVVGSVVVVMLLSLVSINDINF